MNPLSELLLNKADAIRDVTIKRTLVILAESIEECINKGLAVVEHESEPNENPVKPTK